jgi:hypothetical protein
MLRAWLKKIVNPSRPPIRTVRRRTRPWLERLEDRIVPTVDFHGGDIIGHAQAVPVYYDDPTLKSLKDKFDTFLATITNSDYMDMLSMYTTDNGKYAVGRGGFAESILVTDSEPAAGADADHPNTLSDSAIRDMLGNLFDAGINSDPPRVFFVLTPPNVVVTQDNGDTSAKVFLGYHGHFNGNVLYIVLPYPGGANLTLSSDTLSDFDVLTKVASHELAEVATDPHNDGWFDGTAAKGEVGDLVNDDWVTESNYLVQMEAGLDDKPMQPQDTQLSITSILAPHEITDSQVIATFTDTNLAAQATDFTANIDWGDGGKDADGNQLADGSAAYVEASPMGLGQFVVRTGHHEYPNSFPPGTALTLMVEIENSNEGVAGSSAQLQQQVIVQDSPLVDVPLDPISLTEGDKLDGNVEVARFTDDGPLDVITNPLFATFERPGGGTYLASAGLRTNDDGSYSIWAANPNAYTQQGLYKIYTRIDTYGGSFLITDRTVQVGDAGLSAYGQGFPNPMEGIPFTEKIALITDAAPDPLSETYSVVSIDWGDFSPPDTGNYRIDPDYVSGNLVGFFVTATHTYKSVGTHTIHGTIQAGDGDEADFTSPDTKSVDARVDVLTKNTTPTTLPATAGQPTGSHVLATFYDDDPGADASYYSARIAWGDGKFTSASAADGTIVPFTDNTFNPPFHEFQVLGDHVYAGGGTFHADVLVTDIGGKDDPSVKGQNTVRGMGNITFNVTDPNPTVAISGPPFGFRGETLSFTLTASDPNTNDPNAQFTFHVIWGDSVIEDPTGPNGTVIKHPYTSANTYTIKVTAKDQAGFVSKEADDTVTILPVGKRNKGLFVGGTLGSDVIQIASGTQPGSATVTLGGVVQGSYTDVQSITVFGQDGNDDITFGDGTHSLDLLAVPVTIDGGPGLNSFTIDDRGTTHAATWTVANGSVTRGFGSTGTGRFSLKPFFANTATVTYTNITTNLEVDTGSGANSVTVDEHTSSEGAIWNADAHSVTVTAPSLTTTVLSPDFNSLSLQGGSDLDTFNIAPTDQDMNAMPADLLVDGGDGTDVLILDDQKHWHAPDWAITGATVTHTDRPSFFFPGTTRSLSYANIGNLQIHGGAGNETFTLGPDAQHTQALPANMTIDGGLGSNKLVLQGESFSSVKYTTTDGTSGTIVRNATRQLAFQGISAITDVDSVGSFRYVTSTNPDTVNIVNGTPYNQTATTEVNSGAGHTFPTLTFAGKSNVKIETSDGLDTITLNNPTPAAGMTKLTIDAGKSSDKIYIAGTSVETEVHGSYGGDSVTVGSADDTLNALAAPLTVDGDSASNHMIINDDKTTTPTTWTITDSTVQRNGAPLITYYNLTTVDINTGQNNDTVNILGTSAAMKVSTSGGADAVNVGSQGSLQGIRQDVTVAKGGGSTTVGIDGSADNAAETVTLDTIQGTDGLYGRVQGLASGAIAFSQASTASPVTINCGAQGNIITVVDTPSQTITLNTGARADTVGVQATHGPLNIEGQDGADSVSLGYFFGSVQNIRGNVTVTNTRLFTTLTVDDSFDTAGHAVTLDTYKPVKSTFGRIQGLAGGTIAYKQADIASPVTINCGKGADTVTVIDTTIQATNLNTGAQNDTVTVRATHGPLSIDGQSGADTVNIGYLGNAQAVGGAVTVTNAQGQTTLTVDDSADAAPRQVTVERTQADITSPIFGKVTGLAGAPVSFQQTTTASPVTLKGGSGGNAYTVTDTPKVAINLQCGSKNNTVAVQRTHGALNVIGQGGSDQVTVGLNGDARRVLGAVTIMNANANTTVSVDDSADDTARAVTLDTYTAADGTHLARISNLASGAISYSMTNIAAPLAFSGGTGGNTFTIVATSAVPIILNTGTKNDVVAVQSAHAPLSIHGQGGHDAVAIGSTGNAQAVTGAIAIDNQSGQTDVTVDDSTDLIGRAVTLDTFTPTSAGEFGRLRGLAGAEVDFRSSDEASLTIKAGQGRDTVNLAATRAPTVVLAGGGADAVNVASATNNLDAIQGHLTIDGGPGSNQLQVNDQKNANPSVWEVTGGTLDRTSKPAGGTAVHVGVTYSNIQTLAANAGAGADDIKVRGTSAATTMDLGGGSDKVSVGNAANSLDDLHGALTLPDGPGVRTLAVADQGTNAPRSYTLTAHMLARTGAGQITYSGMTAFSLTGGSGTVSGAAGSSKFDILDASAPFSTSVTTGVGDDRVNLVANSATNLAVYDGGGADTIVMGSKAQAYNGTVAASGGNLRGLTGSIYIASYNGHLVVDDSGETVGHTAVRLSDGDVVGLTPAVGSKPGRFLYGTYTSDFYFGKGGNTVTVVGSNDLGSLMDLHAGGGADTFTVAIANDTYYHTVRVDGQSDDTLTIDDRSLTASYGYTLTDGNVSRLREGSLIATSIGYAGLKSVALRCGSGDDFFKVASAPASIPVTLDGGGGNNSLDYFAFASGVTVNLATGKASGFAGISNIANVFGSAFADTLTGDSQRNVLLGGAGADVLNGGDDEDLLIGGPTAYGDQIAVLLAIVREWARTDADYQTRVGHLSQGTGLNTPYVLNATTRRDDSAVDALTGGGGLDWFIITANQDTIANQEVNEQVN